jgi:hypothetical protein
MLFHSASAPSARPNSSVPRTSELREISKRPDGYPADELLAALGGITGSVLGGNLSSVGFGRTYFPEYVWACTRQNGIYLMPSEAAKIIQQRGL